MTTRAYVPNVDGEGSIGTTDKKWGAMYVASPDSTASDNRVASTAWVQKLLADALAKAKLDAHPVGSYYWSNDSTSPATLFGGKWEALPAGYTLIAQGSGSDDFGSYTYTAGQKYGERKHKLTTDELPKFTPTFDGGGAAFVCNNTKHVNTNEGFKSDLTGLWMNTPKTTNAPFNPIGNNAPHNNLPPSVCAYCWKRTA